MTMQTPIPQKVGLTLAAIQLFFTLTWTVYVIFLPQLAAQVGLAKESVLLILMMDQLIFLLADTTMGLAADKAVKVFGKLGRWVVLLTVASCTAFFAAAAGSCSGCGSAMALSDAHGCVVCYLVGVARAAAGAAGQIRQRRRHSLAGQSVVFGHWHCRGHGALPHGQFARV